MANFKDDNHALLMGAFMGCVLKLEEVDHADYQVEPVMDELGNWTDTIIIHAWSGDYVVTLKAGQSEAERIADLVDLEQSLR